MRIDVGQHMRMEQRMKLSPRMIQSMEILQLSTLALEERIDQELEGNPLLELKEVRPNENTPTENTQNDGENLDESPMVVADAANATGEESAQDFQRLAEMTEQYGETWDQNNFSSAESYTPRRFDGERDAKMDAMANTACRGASLTEQLLDQWRFVEVKPTVHRAGEHLIEFIDDDGYLRVDTDQILRQAPPEITRAELEAAIPIIQRKLEPPGIGARSLQECLLLQIDAIADEDGEDDQLHIARRLVTDHLKDIEMNRLPRIAKQAGITVDEVKQGMARLRRLDPRPGRRLAPERPQPIIPDVIVEFDPVHDCYVAALARGRQPSLRISPQYRELSQDRGQDRDTRQYLAKNMNNARWLIDAIRQRNSTLLRVVNVVLDAQRDFFDHGPEHLKPLPMIQVADQLSIHVGTVSRAVSEKYIQTPRGIYPLRMFFSGGTESSDGEEMSWAAVQAKLKQIIDDEDTQKPFSDDQLVEQLKAQGIEIARRTVAKYRQQMNIPPARRRRQY
ncbi:MAG: RNA polymerase factor sigma-54 [Phycisphaeraceae bacterium]